MSSSPYLSVIIPAYRQAGTIAADLQRLNDLIKTLVPSYELVLVIDGNEDNTLNNVRRSLSLPNLTIECFDHNQGKGAALRHGLQRSHGEVVAFIDAGNDIDPSFLQIMLAEFKLHHADIVIGSKRHSLSEVDYPWLRRVYSTTYQILNRLLFCLKVRDTQVGLKICRREVLTAVLPRIVVKKFAFDLELLVVANHLGYQRIVEAPVKIKYNFSSTIRLIDIWRTFIDTLAIFYRLRFLHWYDRPLPAASAPVLVSGIDVSIHHEATRVREKIHR
ncbi:MAG: hypothetical protein A3G57_01905 [Candidatus Andersenbacteria bacterium RIFCSPLOWO2_12_FULL_45_8]|nr:MAG: Glycosyl transferase, family 2 [Parcubacteria group bacterium GW2011_GWA2_45_14]OGY33261.1 MAG: hypothetical protein A3B76_01045 [Candidatus Andersenbacteria bacterium RIFCSPHIGHO2_02_FULL_46_16]OGY38432.1 MAG: hypothetical protein A3I08_02695 [Candidatus Andersenbacteria bacterium RIFCSPLOWO2_02_FULL_46_11]OGY41561.1 MAG: hypothetical protein A3G57_01905 [Candidatus Andersenbacteria bacterium RIFCSPLOWO2_12_FULL_45_8]HBE90860.1 glycosyltransferase family 2 protein [Candidatus Andersenb